MDFSIMVFLTTLQQAAILLIFIFIGYFFRKKNIINDGGRKVLAGLLVNLFAPAYTITSLSSIIRVDNIAQYALMLLAGAVVTLLLVLVSIPFAKIFGKDRLHRNILKYAFAFGNIGYFGYPLVYGVFGAVARAQMMLFCVPMSMTIYSYGYYILTQPAEKLGADGQMIVPDVKKKAKKKLSFLYCMPMIGSYVGIALGLLTSGIGFTVPNFFMDLLTVAGNCQSAPAMLVTGAVLANVPFKKLFTSWKPYVIGLIRLLVIPVIFGVVFFIVYLCGWRDQSFMQIAFIAIVSVSMPVGMNVVVYPESAGQDSTEGAKTCFISYILALVALPVVFTVAMNILNITF